MTTKHTFHVFYAIHVETGIDQIVNTYAIACVLRYHAGVVDPFDRVLLPGTGFAGNIANQFGGNDGNKFDPEVNSLLVEANNFASGLGFVVGWLTMHG